jgi:TonB-dependent SusC/RagA subfamily outer membrane receptor
MKLKILFCLLLVITCISIVEAQKNVKITITGTVTDSDNKPIRNAIIMIDGQKTNSVTDEKGIYKVKIKKESVRIGVFTFGNGIKEEDINGRTTIDISFATATAQQQDEQTVAAGDQAVDVGYAVMKDKNVISPVSKIDGTNKKYASYSNVYDMIQREVSGVKVSGGEIIIQDSKNLWGSIPALLIVDGVYVDSFADIQPSSVQSIEVLKGSSAAMYGSRGYGGVVILKTKIQNEQ